ncbi:hypothetical protein M2444_001381 [Paenibacillus sp. PastF-3]|nr:hypothetical protein [Paenibacillus sp. PastF-3]
MLMGITYVDVDCTLVVDRTINEVLTRMGKYVERRQDC